VADDLSVRYGNLLTGSYDCVDRIVLNAFFPFGCSPGGFRTWWRALHGGSDAQLDDVHLMRMAGRFGRRVRAWGQSAGVPVIYCKPGERKHLIAGQYLAGIVILRDHVLIPCLAGVRAPALASSPLNPATADQHYHKLRGQMRELLHDCGLMAA
jgi:hypothetical protein